MFPQREKNKQILRQNRGWGVKFYSPLLCDAKTDGCQSHRKQGQVGRFSFGGASWGSCENLVIESVKLFSWSFCAKTKIMGNLSAIHTGIHQ
jgi:hypothetical protein